MKAGLRRVGIATLVAVTCLLVPTGTAAANPSIVGSTSGNGMIYIPNYQVGTVEVVDPVSQKVVKTIPDIGDHPLVIRTTPDHSKAYVSNFGPIGSFATVIDMKTDTVIKKIPTLGAPYAVLTMSHDGRYVYLPTLLSTVQVIDTQTDEIVRTLPIAIPPSPAHMELSLDDKIMYVMSGAGTVTKYDTVTGAMIDTPLFLNGFAPGWGAMSADGKTLYAVNYYAGVTWIDIPSWTVTRTVQLPVMAGAISGTLTPDGSKLWICNIGDNTIVELDAHSGEILETHHLDSAPVYAGFSADGGTAWVSSLGGTSNFIDPVAASKLFIAWFPPSEESRYLDVYDTATFTRTGRIEVDDAPISGVYPG
ncbi:YncE family protein [Antrihabitans sp. YC2-6]|uniref:YncE family protein n=1 Tax=Antrihabitans sp. YC2-6 TaxID=2799498 RepID=UPI0018F4B05B|nr:YncE family protein [Antrihabitans sp. YC2-6]MBJ8344360.1 YncE family protein [Antrihabitans sp. YC2-6]